MPGLQPALRVAEREAAHVGAPEATLQDVYHRWFRVVRADTPALREAAYRLRYQVYCVENAFEDPAENPGGMETDEFDARSVHSLLFHRPTDQVAGAVRLVLPDPDNPTGSLPISRVCGHRALSDPIRLPPATTAEISRFSISKGFRRRRVDGRYPNVPGQEGMLRSLVEDRRVLPHMTLGLMNAIVRMSVECGVTHWCAVMEPALLRLLARFGIRFDPLGPIVDYHGRRQPVCADADILLAGIWRESPEIWDVITESGALWPLPECLKAS